MESIAVVEGLSSEGKGIIRENGKVVFVYQGFPGDRLKYQIIQKKKNYAEAKVVSILEPSPFRVKPKCEHLPYCGGCIWQELDYASQLKAKQEKVENALFYLGKLDVRNQILPILPSPLQFHYRNKVDFSFATRRWLPDGTTSSEHHPNGGLGFHVRGTWDRVLHIDTCWLIPPVLNEIKTEIFQLAKELAISFYDPVSHFGALRNLVLRYSFSHQNVMCILIHTEEVPQFFSRLVDRLKAKYPQITSFVQVKNTKKNDYYQDLPYEVVDGEEWIEEELGGKRYRIYPTSFFQVNSLSAKQLFDFIRDSLPPDAKRVLDLYCGVGSILIYLGDRIEKGLGIELVPAAVQAAKENSQLNRFSHLHFCQGDLQQKETIVHLETFQPDVIIVDPPRSGLSKLVRKTIKKIHPPYLFYVSCNPATMARDLMELTEFYQIEKIQPVDQFPHTPHVEVVALCKRKTERK